MMFSDCTVLLSQYRVKTARTEKLYYIGTLGILASCHGAVIWGAFSRLVRSGLLHSLVSVRATMTLQVMLDWRPASKDSEPAPSLRSHVAKLVSTAATKSGAEVASPSLLRFVS